MQPSTSAKIETIDPTTWIVEQTDNTVVYSNTDGRVWKIIGKCNACGLCEPKFESVGKTTIINNSIIVDGVMQKYTRKLLWKDTPGQPNACEEEGYALRKDIPMTADFVNQIDGCSLKGEWIV